MLFTLLHRKATYKFGNVVKDGYINDGHMEIQCDEYVCIIKFKKIKTRNEIIRLEE